MQMEQDKNRNSLLKSQLEEKQQQVTQARQSYDTVVNERLTNLQSIQAASSQDIYQAKRKDSYSTSANNAYHNTNTQQDYGNGGYNEYYDQKQESYT